MQLVTVLHLTGEKTDIFFYLILMKILKNLMICWSLPSLNFKWSNEYAVCKYYVKM